MAFIDRISIHLILLKLIILSSLWIGTNHSDFMKLFLLEKDIDRLERIKKNQAIFLNEKCTKMYCNFFNNKSIPFVLVITWVKLSNFGLFLFKFVDNVSRKDRLNLYIFHMKGLTKSIYNFENANRSIFTTIWFAVSSCFLCLRCSTSVVAGFREYLYAFKQFPFVTKYLQIMTIIIIITLKSTVEISSCSLFICQNRGIATRNRCNRK